MSTTRNKVASGVFRWRGIAPVPVIILGAYLSARHHQFPGPGGPRVDAWLNGIGIALCVMGAALRFYTIACVPPNSSLESRTIQAERLNCTGIYQVVRHPLYLGNLLITVGVLCVFHELPAWILGLGYWIFTHTLIIRSEDQFLEQKFGSEFTQWKEKVRALIPRLSGLRELPPMRHFRRAIQREVNPFVAWSLGITLLLLWEKAVRGNLPTEERSVLYGVALFLIGLLIVNKIGKRFRRA